MKSLFIKPPGRAEDMGLIDIPSPIPQAKQVLLSVEGIGVGLNDILKRQMVFSDGAQPAAISLGHDVAGTVIAVGDRANPSWLQRRVVAFVPLSNCYAEQIAVDEHLLVPLPDGVTSEDAAAVVLNALAAKFVLQRSSIKAGDRVLIRGASGGIGTMATQLALLAGADVSVITRSAEHAVRLKAFGAVTVLDREAKSDGKTADAFDIIVDPVAGPDLSLFFDLLKDGGRLTTCGFAGWLPNADFAEPMFKHILTNRRSLSYSIFILNVVPLDDVVPALAEIIELLAQGKLKPAIHKTLPLSDASVAHAEYESGRTFGRIVLVP